VRRTFNTEDHQGFDGLLACQQFGVSRQKSSARQLLDAFSEYEREADRLGGFSPVQLGERLN
jgi:hypothetical protein